jgi:hypothetical protein
VVSAFLSIEQAVNEALRYLLFGCVVEWDCGDLEVNSDHLVDSLLHSKYLSFDGKRHILFDSLAKTGLFPSKSSEIHALNDNLRLAAKWRNAFAHGRIHFNEGRYLLSYFHTDQKHQELSSTFYEEVEKVYWSAYSGSHDILTKILGWWTTGRKSFKVTFIN